MVGVLCPLEPSAMESSEGFHSFPFFQDYIVTMEWYHRGAMKDWSQFPNTWWSRQSNQWSNIPHAGTRIVFSFAYFSEQLKLHVPPFGCGLPTSADESGDQQLAVSTRDFDQEYMILYICVHLCWRRLLQCFGQVESKVFGYTFSWLRKQWLPVNRRHIEKHAANIIKIKIKHTWWVSI